MCTNNEVLLNDVLYFYKDKPHNPEPSPKDACYYLVETFITGKGKEDDVIYSNEIKRRIDEKKLTELETFKYFTEDEARELVTGGIKEDENGEYSYSQKWHLYVSYIGFKEVASLLDIQNTLVTKITTSDFERSFSISKITQKEFRKWIMKETTSNEDATWEQVKEAISNCRKQCNFMFVL